MESDPLRPTLISLRCPCTHHQWGAPAASSLAARLYALNNRTLISSTKPYSEFILSSHDPNEAVLQTDPPISLSDHIQAQVIEVDPAIVQSYARLHQHGCPFVLKVVSVKTPDGIRVHPDENSARLPFITDSDLFKRPSAKSVMIVALSTVHLLVGFQTASQIVAQLSRVPEFADAIGRSHTDRFVHVVKSAVPTAEDVHHIVATLLAQKPDFVAESLQRAVDRFVKMPPEAVSDDDRLLIALAKKFPDDPMCFSAYLLQRFQIQPGQTIFIQPTETYCVLNGDFADVSSHSDVVFHAGLTAREQVRSDDFLQTVACQESTVEISSGEKLGENGVLYTPPITDFQLVDFKLPGEVSQPLLQTISPTIIVVLEGEGFVSMKDDEVLLPLYVGAVYYLTPQTQFLVTSRSGMDSKLHFLQIGVNEAAIATDSASCSMM